jgi:NitT/TauT family transport system permease protein
MFRLFPYAVILQTTAIVAIANLQIPRMFAALFLTTGLGVLIFVRLSALSDFILSKWHESAVKQEN